LDVFKRNFDWQAKADPAYVGGWKSVPVSNPDKLYDEVKSDDRSEEAPAMNPAPAEPTVMAAPDVKASEVVDVVRAVDAAGSAGAVGAVAAVQAVEAVKAALDSTRSPDTTTPYPTTTVLASGRSLDDDRAQDDAPNTEQTLYGFSRFLHDLLQVSTPLFLFFVVFFLIQSSVDSK